MMNSFFYLIIFLLAYHPIYCQSFFENEKQKDSIIRLIDLYEERDLNQYSKKNVFQEEQGSCIGNNDYIVIGLGCNCRPALCTRKYSVRAFAFPFDWCLTPFQAIYRVINDDFKYFFKRENLIPSSGQNYPDYLYPFLKKVNYPAIVPNDVVDIFYGIVYNHDFQSNAISALNRDYQFHYQKYSRRAERLYKELNSGKRVYFIRYYDISKEQALVLHKLLTFKFPNANLTLIVVGDNYQDFHANWGLPGIKNFYSIGDADPFWQKICNDIAYNRLG